MVGPVRGVAEVEVDLRASTVTVRGSELDDAELREAIEETGYEVRGLVSDAPPARPPARTRTRPGALRLSDEGLVGDSVW